MLGLHNTETTEQNPPVAPPSEPKAEKGGLEGYLDYLGIPKQEYANEPVGEPVSSEPFADDAANEPPEDRTKPNGFNPDNYYDPADIKTIENNIQFSMLPAESIVEVVDIGMTKGAELIAQEKQEGATDDEKERLTKIWAMFLADKNANISPGWMLLAMIVLIYAPKFFMAYQVRKAKQEAERERKRAEKAEAEAERLRKEAEVANIQSAMAQNENIINEAVRKAVENAMRQNAPRPEQPTQPAQPRVNHKRKK